MLSKRAALFTLLLLAGLLATCALWLRAQQRQYALNRALIAVLVKGDDKQALALVEAGADPNTHYEPTPLPTPLELINQLFYRSGTAQNNDSPTAFLIACGTPWNDDSARIDVQGHRPDASQLVQAMLQHGANVNAQDKLTWNPLLWAVFHKRRNTVGVLLEHGVDVNTKEKDGETPLMEAVGNNPDPNIVRMLLQHGTKINAQDSTGYTALSLAVILNPLPKYPTPKIVMEQLLEHGANPNLPDDVGHTPLLLAQDRPDIVAILKQSGAKK